MNDGTFEGDTMLTIPQAAAMLQTKARRQKRYALYFEAPENTIKKWDITSPIPYILDNKLRKYLSIKMYRDETFSKMMFHFSRHGKSDY